MPPPPNNDVSADRAALPPPSFHVTVMRNLTAPRDAFWSSFAVAALGDKGFSPLMVAAKLDHTEVARLLISKGADVEGSSTVAEIRAEMEAEEEEKRRAEAAEAAAEQQRQLEAAKATVLAAAAAAAPPEPPAASLPDVPAWPEPTPAEPTPAPAAAPEPTAMEIEPVAEPVAEQS